MEKDNWKRALGENLTALRKKNNITQSELGEKLNYSDKSVSKWERGEGVPDLSVMVQLSELYGVGIDELLGRAQKPEGEQKKMLPLLRHAAVLITVFGIVLIAALITFAALMIFVPKLERSWLCFVCALPVMFTVMGILFLVWKNRAWAFGALSAALWTACLCIQQLFRGFNAGLIYALGGIVQLIALIVCGFVIMRKAK
ncbi:MAG: helix-turn-helix transcriptional regulator [Clostridia bacterium]|nr:helix-turn-helix transcriptional regulator [Clostridia bacterium]